MEPAGKRSVGAFFAIVATISVVSAISVHDARSEAAVVLNAQSVGTSSKSDDSNGIKAALEREIADRQAADDALRLDLQSEIGASQSALTALRDELASPNTPDDLAFINIDSNEIVDGTIGTVDLADDSVTSSKIANGTIVLADLNMPSIDSTFATDSELAAEALARSTADTSLASFDARLGNQVNGGIPNSITPGDALVDWSRLKGVPSGFADNVDNDSGAAAQAALDQFKDDLAAPAATGVNSGGGLVDFSQLDNVSIDGALITDVDASKLTGQIGATQIADNVVTGAKLALATDKGGAVGFEAIENANIEPGTIEGDRLASRTIGGDRLVLNAITALELADNAVTTDKIQDGQVTRSDLADGAVNTSKVTANIATGHGIGGALSTGTPTVDAATAFLSLPENSVDHKVLVTGQVQLNCAACDSSMESFTYSVKRSGGVAGDGSLFPSYSATAGATGNQVVLPISIVDTVSQSAGSITYILEVTMTTASGTDSVSVVSPMLIVTDLGRA